jgi:S1-C subfamily serine protease
VEVPSKEPAHEGLPEPAGTGFFIHASGLFVTAWHVVEGADISDIWLMKETVVGQPPAMLQWPELVKTWPEYDLALLKLDFVRNANKAFLQGVNAFPFIDAVFDPQEDGTPVYAFGYPLPERNLLEKSPDGSLVAHTGLGPRTTSAIISSSLEMTRPFRSVSDPIFYVFDKALNYGNSGGPIVLTESGRVIAVCVRFQPLFVPQQGGGSVLVPSLYGVASSLSNIRSDLAPLLVQ